MAAAEGWQANLIRDPDKAVQLAGSAKRVAVLGIKTSDKASQPAYFVPQYLQEHGVEVVPVPVYYPDVQEILGQKVYRRVQDVPGSIDVVDVFRRPQDLHQHLDDILAAKPKAVWLQSGISNADFEQQVAQAGIKVVADRCLKVDRSMAQSRL
jgi:predicted CoA-binding protein